MPGTPIAAVTGSLLLGGSSTFLVNFSRAAAELGMRLPIIVLSDQNEHAADFNAVDAPVWTISRARHIYEDRLALGCEELSRWRPRAVLACLGGESFEVLRLVPAGVMRLGIVQSDDPGVYEMIRRYAGWLDLIVGVSATICRQVRSMPELARHRVEHIPYGISFAPASSRVATQVQDPLRLIYVGRLIEEQKRVSRLAGLVRLLRARRVNFQFTFVGAGPQRAALAAELRDVPAVTFDGELPYASVQKRLQQHDVMVLLSDYEGLPLSLIEAMGAGVVPVVSDLESGIREIVNEQSGVRVPVGDVSAAADAIATLACDRQRLATMAAAAQAVRSTYSAHRMAARYLEIVNEYPAGAAKWDDRIRVPVPVGMAPWLYSGSFRIIRRWTKRALATVKTACK